jgi:DNA-binding CsgD family transcriptional regulator
MMGESPLVVACEPSALAAARRELEAEGFQICDGFAIPHEPWALRNERLVLCGGVIDWVTLARVLLAAARGAGVIAYAPEEGPILAALVEDLRRLGPVWLRGFGDADAIEPLRHEERELLERLAAGASLKEAAEKLYLSRRTAQRRLARAREALGVRTTAEALVRFGAAGAPPQSAPISRGRG